MIKQYSDIIQNSPPEIDIYSPPLISTEKSNQIATFNSTKMKKDEHKKHI